MTVDLSLRSDTGNINQSPVSSMASSVAYPCRNFYVIIPGNKRYACLNMRYIYVFELVVHFYLYRPSNIHFISYKMILLRYIDIF